MLRHFLQSRCLLLPVYTNLWTSWRESSLEVCLQTITIKQHFVLYMKNPRRLLITHNVNCQFSILARTINMINLVHIALIIACGEKKAYTVFKKVSTLEEKFFFFLRGTYCFNYVFLSFYTRAFMLSCSQRLECMTTSIVQKDSHFSVYLLINVGSQAYEPF